MTAKQLPSAKVVNPMDLAFDQALLAEACGEVPVGAVVVRGDDVIAAGHNLTRTHKDPTAHAEIVVLRQATRHLGDARLTDCDLYVTLEPCAMCAGALSHARIRRLYFGAEDPKGGAVVSGVRFFDQPSCHHAPDVYGGLQETRSARLLRDFFAKRR